MGYSQSKMMYRVHVFVFNGQNDISLYILRTIFLLQETGQLVFIGNLQNFCLIL